jgi:hypothetical protein
MMHLCAASRAAARTLAGSGGAGNPPSAVLSRWRLDRVGAAAAVGAAVGALAVVSPASASAACASTPVNGSLFDLSGDVRNEQGEPDRLDLGADIASVDVVVDARCNVSIGAKLHDMSTTTANSLADGQLIAFIIDTDGNPATGVDGADRIILTYGDSWGPDLTRLGTANGAQFTFQDAPGTPFEYGGRTMSLDALGVTGSATISIASMSMMDTSLLGLPEEHWIDFARDDGRLTFGVAITRWTVDDIGKPPGPGNTDGQTGKAPVRHTPVGPGTAVEGAAETAAGSRRRGAVRSTVRYGFRRTATWTEFTRLQVRHVPAGAVTRVVCDGPRCPRRALESTRSGSIELRRITGRRFPVGTAITIRVTHPRKRGRTTRILVREGRDPLITSRRR